MSNPNAARRANVHIVFDGADITEDIMPYFLSLSYKDSEEDDSDSMQIDLQDRDSIWLQNWLEKAVSATAASKLKISATITPENWGAGEALPTGDFELDSVEAAGPPSTIKVGGVSLGYSSPIRQTKKSKAWENYNLSAIAGEIAGNGGLGYTSGWIPVLINRDFIPDYDVPQRTEARAGGAGYPQFESHTHDLIIKPYMPKKGEQVLCIYEPVRNGRGFILGGIQKWQ